MKVSREGGREDPGGVRGRHVIVHVRGVSIYLGKKARHGKINKRGCLQYLHLKYVIRFDSQVPNLYIYILSSGQASKQAGPYSSCWLAKIRSFSLLVTHSVRAYACHS
jgi:hypothetical protein